MAVLPPKKALGGCPVCIGTGQGKEAKHIPTVGNAVGMLGGGERT